MALFATVGELVIFMAQVVSIARGVLIVYRLAQLHGKR